jgi:hypothetical protein
MTFTGLDYMINTSDFSQEAGTGQPDRDDDRKNFVAKDFNINVALLE